MFGSKYEMPPVADFEKGDENEYRCPYIPSCPAGANCFAVATPEPLQEKEILNVTCRPVSYTHLTLPTTIRV